MIEINNCTNCGRKVKEIRLQGQIVKNCKKCDLYFPVDNFIKIGEKKTKRELEKMLEENYQVKNPIPFYIIWVYFFGTSLLMSVIMFLNHGLITKILSFMILCISFFGCKLLHDRTKEYLKRR